MTAGALTQRYRTEAATRRVWALGFPGMEARIRQFDGALEIVGGPAGTTINAVIPLVDGWSHPSLEPTEGTLNDLH